MNTSLLPFLRCPSGCASELALHAIRHRGESQVVTGTLRCPECGQEYPIRRGIAQMLPHTLTAETETHTDESIVRKRSEMRARNDQVKDYERMWYLNLFGRIEIPVTMSCLSLRRSHRLLEAGCGTGRMTPSFAAKCDRLVSVDFSLRSLQRNYAKLRQAGITNVDLIQADICHLPLRSDAFDRVVSCQVLEHIPTPESRLMAVKDLARVLRRGGKLVLSAYQHSLLTRMFGEKEGEHDGGIYFYRFSREELRKLLSQALEVRGITGKLVYHFIASCRK